MKTNTVVCWLIVLMASTWGCAGELTSPANPRSSDDAGPDGDASEPDAGTADAGDVDAGRVDGGPIVPPGDLKYPRPAGYENWKTINIDVNGGRYELTEDTWAKFPDSPVRNNVQFFGNGHSLVIIGGHSQIDDRQKTGRANHHTFKLNDDFDEVYIEGFLADGIAQFDQFNCFGCTMNKMVLQNSYFDRNYSGDNRQASGPWLGLDKLGNWALGPDHADTLQIENGSIGFLYIYKVVMGTPPGSGNGGLHGKAFQHIRPTRGGEFEHLDVVLAQGAPGYDDHHGGASTKYGASCDFSKVHFVPGTVFVYPNMSHPTSSKRTADTVGGSGSLTVGMRKNGPILRKSQVGLDYQAP